MKILIVTTSADALGGGRRTGLWLEEFTIPFTKFVESGATVVVASPKGDAVPIDPKTTPTEKDWKKWPQAIAALTRTQRLSDVEAKDFDALFIPGGHGPMMDLVKDGDMLRLITAFDNAGKIIAAVCHGPAALIDAKKSDGNYLIRGRRITGFSNLEERLAGLNNEVPFSLEDALRERTTGYEHGLLPLVSHMVKDGNLITGQNPASAKAVADAVSAALGAAR